MPRIPLPLIAEDISTFARSMRTQLAGRTETPGHLELLNILARSAGHRNFQHLRAQTAAGDRLDNPAARPVPDRVDFCLVERVAGHFDRHGALLRWPGKRSHQQLCLWALWAHVAARRSYREAEINALLQARHRFGDHALLRRELCDAGLLSRTPDGRCYRRIERKPPVEAAALTRHLAARSAGTGDAS